MGPSNNRVVATYPYPVIDYGIYTLCCTATGAISFPNNSTGADFTLGGFLFNLLDIKINDPKLHNNKYFLVPHVLMLFSLHPHVLVLPSFFLVFSM